MTQLAGGVSKDLASTKDGTPQWLPGYGISLTGYNTVALNLAIARTLGNDVQEKGEKLKDNRREQHCLG